MTDHFILEAIDADTGCVAEKFPFSVDDLAVLASALALQTEDLGENLVYELDQTEAFTLREKFGIEMMNGSYQRFWLRHRHSIDDLPYEVHTDRELLLMLKGTKPLAHFSLYDVPEERALDPANESYFEPHVLSGKIKKHEWLAPLMRDGACQVRHVFYALPGEEWRIKAFIQLIEDASKSGWDEKFERREGELLGYTDREMDIYMKRWKAQQSST